MTDTTTTEGLTAVQIAALRKSDSVCFYHHEGKSYIRAIKRRDPDATDPFTTEQSVHVPCETRWTDYSRETGCSYPVPQFVAFQSVGNYDDSEWRTIASLLRAGDKLTLHWMRDAARTQGLEEARFHADRLTLFVDRGNKRMRFHVSTSVCPDNTARMIRDVRPVPMPALPRVVEVEVEEGEAA